MTLRAAPLYGALALLLAFQGPVAALGRPGDQATEGAGIDYPASECITRPYSHRVTAYVRGEGSDFTADGTSVWSREWLVATGPEYPFGATVWIEGLGHYRVADRGGGVTDGMIDVLVDSRDEAYNLTSSRRVCRVK